MRLSSRFSGFALLAAGSSVGVFFVAYFAPDLVVLAALINALVDVLALFAVAEKRQVPSQQTKWGSGSYEIISKLSEGGMGIVYRARHLELGREVAVKSIQPVRVSEDDQTRFRREARVLSSLASPHTINVFDAGVKEDDGTLFYVMELLDGRNLRELVQASGPLSAARVIHVLRQASLSLSEAHAKGLVHRDLKPENLMLCRYGGEFDFVKILDFGLVKGGLEYDLSDAITEAGELPGTPAFLAPESVSGGKFVDARADLYSLGAVGYFLLTGLHLFPEESPVAMVRAQLSTPPPRARENSPAPVPAALDELINQCLRKNKEERPADAETLLLALERLALEHPWTREQARACWTQVPSFSDRASMPPALPSESVYADR